jgi:uncharacterized protein YndB with AHSA1/START domain
MADIVHFMVIRAPREKVYGAITEQKGLCSCWTRDSIARPEVGFVNEILQPGNYGRTFDASG